MTAWLRVAAVGVAALAAAPAAGAHRSPPERWRVPAAFYPAALCVHSGWHWAPARTRRERRVAEYHLAPRFHFRRTWNVPDSIPGGAGEGGWTAASSAYGGGLQFTLGTWNRAAALSRGGVPYVRSTSTIARQPARVQILAAYLIVRQDGSWREWPQTSRACGLR